MHDENLHFAAAAVFAKICQASDPDTAGSEYAEFFFKFTRSFSKRTVEIENEGDDYRYGDILTSGKSMSPRQPISSSPPSPPSRPQVPPGGAEDDGQGRTF